MCKSILYVLSCVVISYVTFFLCYVTSWKLILAIWIVLFILYMLYYIIYNIKYKKECKKHKIKRETLTMSNVEAVKKRKKYKH